jgi:hypothetical protein
MLPRIQAADPVTQPATVEKTFPDLYLRQMVVRSYDGQPTSLSVRLQRYNFDTKEFAEGEVPLRIDDLFAPEYTGTLIQQVMGQVLAVTGIMAQRQQYQALISAEQTKETPDEAYLDACQTALAAINTQLGFLEG